MIYLILINLVAVCVFAHDKHAARRGHWRTPEAVLHLLELLGGVFSILPMMYFLRHKNRKFSYYMVTYLILFIDIFLIWYWGTFR